MLTKKELAEKLNISTATLDRWVRTRGLPHFKVGRTIRFDWKRVEEWLGADKK